MKLTPPTFGVWLIALLLGGGGIAAKFGYVPVLAPHASRPAVPGLGLPVAATLFSKLRSPRAMFPMSIIGSRSWN